MAMVAALVVFLLGTRTYRYSLKRDEENPFLRIDWVFVTAVRNWRITPSAIAFEEEAQGTLPHHNSQQFK